MTLRTNRTRRSGKSSWVLLSEWKKETAGMLAASGVPAGPRICYRVLRIARAFFGDDVPLVVHAHGDLVVVRRRDTDRIRRELAAAVAVQAHSAALAAV